MIARLAFSHFFVPNGGLPKLVIVDGGSEMKVVLIAMCELRVRARQSASYHNERINHRDEPHRTPRRASRRGSARFRLSLASTGTYESYLGLRYRTSRLG